MSWTGSLSSPNAKDWFGDKEIPGGLEGIEGEIKLISPSIPANPPGIPGHQISPDE
jgi:hypothetical protein